jgi:hypothetical protein
MISDKIRPHHLERKALLYVRQSSAHQVLHNRESSALQYAMRDRLAGLGWSQIEVIDNDLGRVAAGSVQRAGFERPMRTPSTSTAFYDGATSVSGGLCFIDFVTLSRMKALIVEPISCTWRNSWSYSSGRSFTMMRTVQVDLSLASVIRHQTCKMGARFIAVADGTFRHRMLASEAPPLISLGISWSWP